MKKKPWLWAVLGGVVLVLIVVAGLAKGGKGKVEPVQLARVRRQDVTARVRAPGKIEPKTQVKVSADIMGKIVHLLVKEGDPVRRGQLMLELDDTQYRSLNAQAVAALASAREHVQETRTSMTVAEATYKRQKALFDQKLLSEAEWDAATAAYESARAAAATAREDVARAQAAADGAADNLRKCHFSAPFDGVVSALNVEQGEIVVTGTMNNPGTEILTVSDLSRMLVRADVDETDVVDMRVGQKVKISVDAVPDTTFSGTVTEIGNTAKASITSTVSGQTSFQVKIVFDENVPQVRPGMTADVDIQIGTHPRTLAVPIQAVVVRSERDLQRAARGAKAAQPKPARTLAVAAEDDTAGKRDKEITGVFVVRNDVASFVPVRTGLQDETMIEVRGDVHEGDTVVSGPYKALRELKPGGRVKRETAAAAVKK